MLDIFPPLASSVGWANAFALVLVCFVPVNCIAIFLACKKHPHPIVGGALATGKLLMAVYVFFMLWPLMWYDRQGSATVEEWLWLLFNRHNTITVAIFLVNFITSIVALVLSCYTFGKHGSTNTGVAVADPQA